MCVWCGQGHEGNLFVRIAAPHVVEAGVCVRVCVVGWNRGGLLVRTCV